MLGGIFRERTIYSSHSRKFYILINKIVRLYSIVPLVSPVETFTTSFFHYVCWFKKNSLFRKQGFLLTLEQPSTNYRRPFWFSMLCTLDIPLYLCKVGVTCYQIGIRLYEVQGNRESILVAFQFFSAGLVNNHNCVFYTQTLRTYLIFFQTLQDTVSRLAGIIQMAVSISAENYINPTFSLSIFTFQC